MRFQPIVSNIDAHLHRNCQRQRILHLLFHYIFHCLKLWIVDIKHQLVVHLKNHFRFKVQFLELAPNTYHRYLDHICRCALYWHIDGIALGKLAQTRVAAVDVIQITPTPKQRLRLAILAGKSDIVVNILLN